MQVKSLKSQAMINLFSKLSTAFLGSKAMGNIRILSFEVKTKNACLLAAAKLGTSLPKDLYRFVQKNLHGTLKNLGPIRV